MIALTSFFSGISKASVLRYLFMPQILPRLEEFYRTGFSHLAHIIAQVYRSVNILPASHPVFTRENRKSLSIRSVMAAAAAELKYDRNNIDKVILYFLILGGIALLFGQIMLTIGFLMLNPALAQTMPTTYAAFFATPSYDTDIAYRLLYSVFGVPEIFNPSGTGSNYHVALHALFQFYSIGLLVIAVIITCYYVFAVAVETAQTGVPFGKRYNHVWTPIRLVVALGMLIPMGYGLNAAQWVTLYAAKFGSDFATQGWVLFNNTMNQAYLNNPDERVGRPQNPNIMPLVRFMMMARACREAYLIEYGATIDISAYLVKSAAPAPLRLGLNFDQAYDYFNKGDMLIRFGEFNAEKHKDQLGGVYPYCGELKLNTSDISEVGTLTMQGGYFAIVNHLWAGTGGTWTNDVFRAAQDMVFNQINTNSLRVWNASVPQSEFKRSTSNGANTFLDNTINNAVSNQANSPTWQNNLTLISQQGWGGAGMWYNKIAQINGSLVAAVNAVPYPTLQPAVMERMKTEQLQQNINNAVGFDMGQSDGKEMQFDSTVDAEIARILLSVDRFWSQEDSEQGDYSGQVRSTNNWFIDTINLIFGTRGLFNMCANADVHPLAQLSILGKGLVESSIRNLGLAFGFGLLGVLPIPLVGPLAGVASSILTSIATITLSMGFMMFYVLPFMPFLYFFFAVGSWVKGLFEAMVGVPLWALAHLRIDGEGLPGDAAMDGYYLVFEIFLRPILIVFGLLAAVIIFGSTVKVLNEIFTLVVANLSGHDEGFTSLCGRAGGGAPSGSAVAFFRGPIDELFYTILYAIIVYMIGMSCFKLIDLIPNNILRYMGSRATTYNDAAQDPAEGLMFKLSVGSSQIGGQLVNIGKNASQAAGGLTKGVAEVLGPPKQQ